MLQNEVVYISGKMTGLHDYNRHLFRHVEAVVREIGCLGVFNPAHFPDGWSYQEYIDRGMDGLRGCTVMLRIPGWQGSNGVRIETEEAERLGIKIIDLAPCFLARCPALTLLKEVSP